MHALRRQPGWLVATGLGLWMLVAAAAGLDADAQQDGTGARGLEISVQAEVVEAGAPAVVRSTGVSAGEGGLLTHGVRVAWTDDTAAVLDDARFTHHVQAESGEGDLVTAGRGCGAQWDAQAGRVLHVCTADLQLIELSPDQLHTYPVAIYPTLDPLRLEPGTYVVEQPIEWWRPGDESDRQTFTVRLTYTVTSAQADEGTFTPEPAASGSTLATWGGGAISLLPGGATYWVAVEGEFIGYVAGAPEFVNAEFRALYPDGTIPAGTLMVVVRP